MEDEKKMSMTKSGIIGLVVLIVILIGGYSLLTRSGGNEVLTDNGTSTVDMTGTSTEATSTATTSEEEEPTLEETPQTEATDTNDTADTQANADTNTGEQNTNSGNTGIGMNTGESNEFGGGLENNGSNTFGEGTQAPKIYYVSDNTGLHLRYPATWEVKEKTDLDHEGGKIVMHSEFAGGMKSEMTITTFDNARMRTSDMVENDKEDDEEGDNEHVINIKDTISDGTTIVPGRKYQTKLDCGGEDLDCAGEAYVVPVSGHMTEDGWRGKVVMVSYGVFQEADYDGPDVGVSASELYEVAQSAFENVAASITTSDSGTTSSDGPTETMVR